MDTECGKDKYKCSQIFFETGKKLPQSFDFSKRPETLSMTISLSDFLVSPNTYIFIIII